MSFYILIMSRSLFIVTLMSLYNVCLSIFLSRILTTMLSINIVVYFSFNGFIVYSFIFSITLSLIRFIVFFDIDSLYISLNCVEISSFVNSLLYIDITTSLILYICCFRFLTIFSRMFRLFSRHLDLDLVIFIVQHCFVVFFVSYIFVSHIFCIIFLIFYILIYLFVNCVFDHCFFYLFYHFVVFVY